MLGERSYNLVAKWRLGFFTLERIFAASEAERYASLSFEGVHTETHMLGICFCQHLVIGY